MASVDSETRPGTQEARQAPETIPQAVKIIVAGGFGAGKTTVFNLITGVFRPSQGSIIFQVQNLVGHQPHEIISRGIARTFQNVRLFKELSVLDNVRIAHYTR